ncbi:hypothetical protein PENANT_c042G03889 [Penicillium antarcticum]|uniref:Uncharacterized protein n=1 Tax=Penicillium antarcticum TaxID=416450 RepID=A0A1V6PT41_9EURO|nr:hypothetical protein PENANT_c042G03889 [Penicillium antarcticum]
MKAIVIEKFGGPESLVIKDVPTPEPKHGEVVIRIKAFGANNAEMHLGKGEWAEWSFGQPDVCGHFAFVVEPEPVGAEISIDIHKMDTINVTHPFTSEHCSQVLSVATEFSDRSIFPASIPPALNIASSLDETVVNSAITTISPSRI